MTRAAAAVAALVAALAGCSDARSPAPTPSTTAATTTVVTTTTTLTPRRDPETFSVVVDDYQIRPATNTLAAGAYSFLVFNEDDAPHDVVLIETELPIDGLPTAGIRVDEQDNRLSVRARTSRIGPSGVGSLMATLQPGRYLLVCTVPHHYVRDLMAVELRVT